jgi:hypothetical protein
MTRLQTDMRRFATTRPEDVADEAAAAFVRALGMLSPIGADLGVHFITPDVARVRTGAGVVSENGILTLEKHPDPAAVLDAGRLFQGSDMPWTLQLRDTPSPEMESVASELGLANRATVPMMICEWPPYISNSELDKHVKVLEPFRAPTFVSAMATKFDMGPDALQAILTTASFDRSGVSAYVLEEHDGQIATAGLTTLDGPMLGVFDGSGRRANWKSHPAASLTERMIVDGFTYGARTAFLQSSSARRPEYERIGFRSIENWTYFA